TVHRQLRPCTANRELALQRAGCLRQPVGERSDVDRNRGIGACAALPLRADAALADSQQQRAVEQIVRRDTDIGLAAGDAALAQRACDVIEFQRGLWAALRQRALTREREVQRAVPAGEQRAGIELVRGRIEFPRELRLQADRAARIQPSVLLHQLQGLQCDLLRRALELQLQIRQSILRTERERAVQGIVLRAAIEA